MNICVFGDSIARGVIYDENKGRYVISSKGFLDIISEEMGIEIKNYAKFGCTTVKAEKIIDKHLDELSKYDYTLLELGGNDCDLDWKAASDSPLVKQTGQIRKEDFIGNYMRIIEKVKKSGGTPLLLTLPPLEPARFFEWVTRDLDKFNVMEFLENDRSNIYRWQQEYSALVFEIGEMTDTPVIDIRRAFLEAPSYEALMCKDGMHPNEKGHRAIASFLEDEWLCLMKCGKNIMDWEQLLSFEFDIETSFPA